MPSLRERFEILADDVGWFARATELRLHLVLVEEDLRESALGLIARGAQLGDATVPYLLFTEPFAGSDAGWNDRIIALNVAYEAVRAALAERQTVVTLPAMPPAAAAPHATFAARLARLVDATAPAMTGAVCIVAPDRIEASERLLTEASALLFDPMLTRVRWVIVLRDEASVASLLARLGPLALVSACVSPPEESAETLARWMHAATSAPAGAPALARAGMAWPSQAPPPRRRNGVPIPLPVSDPQETARANVRLALLDASLRQRTGKAREALEALRTAYEAAARGGLVEECVTLRLAMAPIMAQLGDRERGLRELLDTQHEATSLQRPLLAAQAASARAALLAAVRQTDPALRAYDDAIELARSAGDSGTNLLFELLRAAGQLHLNVHDEPRAVQRWREALDLVSSPAPGLSLASAVETARDLAALCRQRGLTAQATSLEAQAAQLEAQGAPSGAM